MSKGSGAAVVKPFWRRLCGGPLGEVETWVSIGVRLGGRAWGALEKAWRAWRRHSCLVLVGSH